MARRRRLGRAVFLVWGDVRHGELCLPSPLTPPQQTLNPYNSLFDAFDKNNRSGTLNSLGEMYVAGTEEKCSSAARVAPGVLAAVVAVVLIALV